MTARADRRVARASWEIVVQRERGGAGAGDDDDLYWLRFPQDERARLTWELSRELYSIAARDGGVFDEETGTFAAIEEDELERRLPRAALVPSRR
jgi:hypothetical protein